MRHLIRSATIATMLLMSVVAAAAARSGGNDSGGTRLAQMCEAGSRDITAFPVEAFQRVVGEDADKRAALDALTNAAAKAAQDIKAACPAQTPPNAPARLLATQTRLEALSAAVMAVRPPLVNFYRVLSDEQKEAVVAALGSSRQGQGGGLLDPDCGTAQPGVWPAAVVERAVHPNEAQHASLTALEEAAAKAADLSKGGCPAGDLLTPTARLEAVGKRLDALLAGVKALLGPLNDFYGMLSDGQKARFDAISLPQTSQAEPSKARPAVRHHRGFVNLGYLIRRFLRGF